MSNPRRNLSPAEFWRRQTKRQVICAYMSKKGKGNLRRGLVCGANATNASARILYPSEPLKWRCDVCENKVGCGETVLEEFKLKELFSVAALLAREVIDKTAADRKYASTLSLPLDAKVDQMDALKFLIVTYSPLPPELAEIVRQMASVIPFFGYQRRQFGDHEISIFMAHEEHGNTSMLHLDPCSDEFNGCPFPVLEFEREDLPGQTISVSNFSFVRPMQVDRGKGTLQPNVSVVQRWVYTTIDPSAISTDNTWIIPCHVVVKKPPNE